MLRSKRFWLGLLASVFFLGIFVGRTDVPDTWRDLKAADYTYAVPAIATLFGALWFRAQRWGQILRPLRPLSTLRVYPYVTIGSMANNVLPARAGELVRSYVLAERYGLKKMAVLGSVAVDRLFDGIALLLLFVALVFVSEVNAVLRNVGIGAALAFGLTAVVLLWATSDEERTRRVARRWSRVLPGLWRERGVGWVDSFLVGLRPLRDPRRMAVVLALSFATWATEAAAYYIFSLGFEMGEGFPTFLLVAAAANLAIALPPSQGGIGPFEIVTRETLVAAGSASATASAYAVALHAALLLPVIAAGVLFLWAVHLPLEQVLGAAAREEPPGREGVPALGVDR